MKIIVSLQHFFLKPFKVRSPVNQYYLKKTHLKPNSEMQVLTFLTKYTVYCTVYFKL